MIYIKRIWVILLSLFLILLCSCNESDTVSRKEIEVLLPDGSLANGNSLPDTIDGNSVIVETEKPALDYYVGNNSSKKFHSADCSHAEKIKDANKVYFSSYDEFLKNGFTPCKSCNP